MQDNTNHKLNKHFDWKILSFQKVNEPDRSSQLKIILKKNFKFEEDVGLVWYKNLNIPSIKLICSDSTDFSLPPFNLKSKICCAYRNIHDDEQILLIDMVGKTEQTLKWGECEFTGLRFQNTSHINKGCYYHIIIYLFQDLSSAQNQGNDTSTNENQQNELKYDKIVGQVAVSSPLYIHSRKKAHKERQSKMSFYDPFPPDAYQKVQQHFTNNNEIEIVIESCNSNQNNKEPDNQAPELEQNGLHELNQYLSNKRIRHKIYHPLFLLFNFPKALKLYYNTNIVKETQDSSNFLSSLQATIMEQFDRKDKQDLKLKDKVLLLCLNGSQNQIQGVKSEKVIQFLKCLDGPVISQFSQIPYSIHKNFKEISWSKILVDTYQTNYKTCQFNFLCCNTEKTFNKIQTAKQSNHKKFQRCPTMDEDGYEEEDEDMQDSSQSDLLQQSQFQYQGQFIYEQQFKIQPQTKIFHTSVIDISKLNQKNRNFLLQVKAVKLFQQQ